MQKHRKFNAFDLSRRLFVLLRFCVQSSRAKHWQPLELLMKESKSSHVSRSVRCRESETVVMRGSLYVSARVSRLHPLDCAAPVNTAASRWCSRGSEHPHMDLVNHPLMLTSGHTTRPCVGCCMCVCERETLQMPIILVHNHYHSSKVVFHNAYHCNYWLWVNYPVSPQPLLRSN